MREDKKYYGKDALSIVDNAFNSVINDIVNNYSMILSEFGILYDLIQAGLVKRRSEK